MSGRTSVPPEVEVLRVGAGTGEDGRRVVVLETEVVNVGPPVRVGGWSVRARLVDGRWEELPVRPPSGPVEVRFPRGEERTVTAAEALDGGLDRRPVETGEDRAGVLVCGTRGLPADELLGNGTTYVVRFRDGEGREGEARHLVSVGPSEPGAYFPGLGGT